MTFCLLGPTVVTQQTSGTVTTPITTYTLANNTYFYETTANFSVARAFTQPTFTTLAQQQQNQQIRSSALNTNQVHGKKKHGFFMST